MFQSSNMEIFLILSSSFILFINGQPISGQVGQKVSISEINASSKDNGGLNSVNLSPSIKPTIVIQTTEIVTTELPASNNKNHAIKSSGLSLDTLIKATTGQQQLEANKLEQQNSMTNAPQVPLTVASLDSMRKEASQRVKKGLMNSLGFLPFYNVKGSTKNTATTFSNGESPPPSHSSMSTYGISDETVNLVDPASFAKSSHRQTVPKRPSPLRWG